MRGFQQLREWTGRWNRPSPKNHAAEACGDCPGPVDTAAWDLSPDSMATASQQSFTQPSLTYSMPGEVPGKEEPTMWLSIPYL